jgi:hypothetical protein
MKETATVLVCGWLKFPRCVLEGNSLRGVVNFFEQNPVGEGTITPVVPSFFILLKDEEIKLRNKLSCFPTIDSLKRGLPKPAGDPQPQAPLLPRARGSFVWPAFSGLFFSCVADGVRFDRLSADLSATVLRNLYREFGQHVAGFHNGNPVRGIPLYTKIVHCDLNPQNILVKLNGYTAGGDFSKCIFSVIDWEFAIYNYFRDGDLLSFLCHVFCGLPQDCEDPRFEQRIEQQMGLATAFLEGYCAQAYGLLQYAVLTTNGLGEISYMIDACYWNYSFSGTHSARLKRMLRPWIVQSTDENEPNHINRSLVD